MPDAVFVWTVRDVLSLVAVIGAFTVFVVREFRRKP